MRKRTTGLFLGLVTAVSFGVAMTTAVAAEPPKTTTPPAKAPATQTPAPTTAPKAAAPAAGHDAAMPAAAKIGAPAPAFATTDLNGKAVKLADFKGKTVVLEWFNPECPFVVKSYQNKVMGDTFAKYKDKNVVWLLVNSSAPGKEGSSPETNKAKAAEWGITNPVLMDTTGAIGKMYGAKTTPHMYIINKDGVLSYMGAIDNNANGDKFGKPDYINYVDQALKQVLAGETVTQAETKSYGCGVKYAG